MWLPVSAVIAPPTAALVMAATDPTAGFNPYSLIGSAVTPVIVVVLLLFGKLRTETELKRLEEEINGPNGYKEQIRLKDEQLQLSLNGLLERVVPALTRSTLVLENLAPMLQTEVTITRPPPRPPRRARNED